MGVIILVHGCQTRTDFTTMPSSKLCLDYLTKSQYNSSQSYRETELYNRNEDCAVYAGAAAEIKAGETAARAVEKAARRARRADRKNEERIRKLERDSSNTKRQQGISNEAIFQNCLKTQKAYSCY